MKNAQQLLAEILRIHAIREEVNDVSLTQSDVLKLAGEYQRLGRQRGIAPRLRQLRKLREELGRTAEKLMDRLMDSLFGPEEDVEP